MIALRGPSGLVVNLSLALHSPVKKSVGRDAVSGFLVTIRLPDVCETVARQSRDVTWVTGIVVSEWFQVTHPNRKVAVDEHHGRLRAGSECIGRN